MDLGGYADCSQLPDDASGWLCGVPAGGAGSAMTPQEFADAHGLSLEEAHLILEKRNRPALPANSSLSTDIDDISRTMDRLSRARRSLAKAHKKVGAAEVSVDGDEVVKGDFSSENLERFYSTKGGADSTHPRVKPDPDAWEEPP